MKDFRTAFKAIANEKKNTAWNHISLCVLRAMVAKTNKDKYEIATAQLMRAFSLNKRSCEYDYQGIYNALISNGLVLPREGDLSKYGFPYNQFESHEEHVLFCELVTKIRDSVFKTGSFPDKEYAFIFVRKDISPEQIIVQSNHASIELGHRLSTAGHSITNLHIALIGVDDLSALETAGEILRENNFQYVFFLEPDMDNEVTAIASYPIKSSEKRFLRGYDKLSFANL